MPKDEILTAGEQQIMAMTMKAALLRAADVIDNIKASDVLDAQVAMYRSGVSLSRVQLVDRAMIASAHLRSCAAKGEEAQATIADIVKLMEARHG